MIFTNEEFRIFMVNLLGIIDSFHDFGKSKQADIFIHFIYKTTKFKNELKYLSSTDYKHTSSNSISNTKKGLIAIYDYLLSRSERYKSVHSSSNYLNTRAVRKIMFNYITNNMNTLHITKNKLIDINEKILNMFTKMAPEVNINLSTSKYYSKLEEITVNNKNMYEISYNNNNKDIYYILQHRNLLYHIYYNPDDDLLMNNIKKIFNLTKPNTYYIQNINKAKDGQIHIVTYPISDIDDISNSFYYPFNKSENFIKYTINNNQKKIIDQSIVSGPEKILLKGDALINNSNNNSNDNSNDISNDISNSELIDSVNLINLDLSKNIELSRKILTFNHLNTKYSFNGGINIIHANINVTFYKNNAGGRSDEIGLLNLARILNKCYIFSKEGGSYDLTQYEVNFLVQIFDKDNNAKNAQEKCEIFLKEVYTYVFEWNITHPTNEIEEYEVIIYLAFGAKRYGDWIQQIIGRTLYFFVKTTDFYCILYGILIGAPVIISNKKYCESTSVKSYCKNPDLYNIKPKYIDKSYRSKFLVTNIKQYGPRVKEEEFELYKILQKFPIKIVDNYNIHNLKINKNQVIDLDISGIIGNTDPTKQSTMSAKYIEPYFNKYLKYFNKYLKYKYKYLKLNGANIKKLNKIKDKINKNKYLKYKTKYQLVKRKNENINENQQNENINENQQNENINENQQNENINKNQQNKNINEYQQNENINKNQQNKNINEYQQNENINEYQLNKKMKENDNNKYINKYDTHNNKLTKIYEIINLKDNILQIDDLYNYGKELKVIKNYFITNSKSNNLFDTKVKEISTLLELLNFKIKSEYNYYSKYLEFQDATLSIDDIYKFKKNLEIIMKYFIMNPTIEKFSGAKVEQIAHWIDLLDIKIKSLYDTYIKDLELYGSKFSSKVLADYKLNLKIIMANLVTTPTINKFSEIKIKKIDKLLKWLDEKLK